MVRRIRFAALVACAVPAVAGAQIGRAPRGGFISEPGYWVGLSYGFLDGITLNDGRSNSTWRFGASPQIRATLEKSVGSGVTVGASAGFSTPNVLYTGGSIGSQCALSCNANAEVNQYVGFVRGGGGMGFHTLFNLEAGMTQFSRFRDRASGVDLDPSSAYDFTFGLGGGFGYGFSRNMDVYLNEQVDLVLHHQGDVVASTVPRMSVFRLGARVGF